MRSILLLLAILVLPASGQDPKSLVEQLRSENAEERDTAARALRGLKRAALPELENAARSADPDLSQRAADLILRIRTAEALTPALLSALPGADARLATRDDHEWTKVLAEAVASDAKTLAHPELTRRDLEPLIARAARGARTDDERSLVCETADHWRIRSAAGEVVRLLGSPQWTERGKAMSCLWRIASPAEIPELLKLLDSPVPDVRKKTLAGLPVFGGAVPLDAVRKHFDDPDKAVREAARCVADGRKAAPSEGALLVRLEYPNYFTRLEALQALEYLQTPEAVKAIVARLEDVQPEVRAKAVEGTCVLAAEDWIPRVVKLLGDPDPQVRKAALKGLARRRIREAGSAAARLLEDPDPEVQASAVAALADLGYAEANPRIIALLKSKDDKLCGAAARACGVLGLRTSIPDLHAILEGDDLYGSRESYRALARLGEKGLAPRLSEACDSDAVWVRSILLDVVHTISLPEAKGIALQRLADSNDYVRTLAAKWLCRLGSPAGVPVLLDQSYSLLSINRLRRPDLVQKLEDIGPPLRIARSVREMLDLIAKDSGLAVEWPAGEFKGVLGDPNRPMDGAVWMRWSCAFDAIEDLTSESFGAILETGRIRILPRDEAETFWRSWLAERRSGK